VPILHASEAELLRDRKAEIAVIQRQHELGVDEVADQPPASDPPASPGTSPCTKRSTSDAVRPRSQKRYTSFAVPFSRCSGSTATVRGIIDDQFLILDEGAERLWALSLRPGCDRLVQLADLGEWRRVAVNIVEAEIIGERGEVLRRQWIDIVVGQRWPDVPDPQSRSFHEERAEAVDAQRHHAATLWRRKMRQQRNDVDLLGVIRLRLAWEAHEQISTAA